MINEIAVNYWEEQKLAAAVVQKLRQGPHQFGVATEWHARLLELGITAERHIRIASEGALLGSLIAHGVSSELGILSDGAGQFDVLVHIACWIHAERPLTRMVPYSDRTPGGHRGGAAADLGALPGPQRVSLGTSRGPTADSGSAVR